MQLTSIKSYLSHHEDKMTSSIGSYDRCIYPELGRKLTQGDLGKHVVRVIPRNEDDWSHCFYKDTDLNYRGGQLKTLSDQNVTIHCKIYFECEEAFIDSNGPFWTTREEVETYLKSNPVGVIKAFAPRECDSLSI